jgi:hypothetical protein
LLDKLQRFIPLEFQNSGDLDTRVESPVHPIFFLFYLYGMMAFQEEFRGF